MARKEVRMTCLSAFERFGIKGFCFTENVDVTGMEVTLKESQSEQCTTLSIRHPLA